MIIGAILVFLLSTGLLFHFYYRPLSEDDGNWFYLAQFWSKGVRPFTYLNNKHCAYQDNSNIYLTNGFFNFQFFIAIVYNYLVPTRYKKVKVFNLIKILWISLTSSFIFIVCFLILKSYIYATSSALIFTYVISCSKKNWSDLTYAEIYQILPFTISVMLAIISIHTGNLYYLLGSGFFSAISFQIKINILPLCLLTMVFYSVVSKSFLLFVGGFLLLNILPIFFLLIYNNRLRKKAISLYLKSILSPFVTVFVVFKYKFLKKCYNPNIVSKNQVFAINNYVFNTQEKNSNTKNRREILKALNEQLMQFPLIYFLTVFQILISFMNINRFSLFNSVSLILWICIILIQNKKYYPSFNSIWLNISFLAGMSIYMLITSAKNNNLIFIFLIMLLLTELFKWLKNIKVEFKKENREKLAQLFDNKQIVLQKSELIAKDIQKHLKDNERYLVWGNLPNLHIYSKHMSFNWNLFAYPNALLSDLSFYFCLWSAPKIIFWCPPIKETIWNINKINEYYRTSYEILKVYPFGLRNKESYIFKLNTSLYIEILLEQAFEIPRFDYFKSEKNFKWITHCMNKIKEINPNHYLANHYESIFKKQHSTEHLISYLEDKIKGNNDNFTNSQDMYLLAKEHASEDDFQQSFDLLSSALLLNQTDWKIYNALGEAYAMLSDMNNAFICFQKALELNPYSSKLYGNLSFMSYYAGEYKEALFFNEKALRINPNNQEALANAEALKKIFGN